MPGRPSLALAIVVLLAACSAAPVVTEEPHTGHEPGASGAPSTPPPSAREGADGSIDLEADFVLGGDGISVADALEAASSQPVLVSGILLRDADGGIWFCDELDEADPPSCGHPRLAVANFPDDEAVFAAENAEDTGARTSGDVTWVPEQLLFGVVHPAR